MSKPVIVDQNALSVYLEWAVPVLELSSRALPILQPVAQGYESFEITRGSRRSRVKPKIKFVVSVLDIDWQSNLLNVLPVATIGRLYCDVYNTGESVPYFTLELPESPNKFKVEAQFNAVQRFWTVKEFARVDRENSPFTQQSMSLPLMFLNPGLRYSTDFASTFDPQGFDARAEYFVNLPE